MMNEDAFRKKITWFNFVCCLLVIWNHAGNAELFFPGIAADAPLMRLQYRVTPELIRVNIPGFLMLSGYLFYRNFTPDQLAGKWKRRVHSLLIPYLLWNALYYAAYLAASYLDVMQGIINRTGLAFTLSGALRAIVKYEFNPVFWFMYQLLWLVLLAPVLYFFLKGVRRGALFLAALTAAVFAGVSLPELNLDALLYYSAAAYAALHLRNAAEAPWNRRRFACGAALLALGLLISRPYYTDYFVPGIVFYQLFASVGFWLMVPEKRLGKIRPVMTMTFFIYAFHFVPVRFLNKAAALLFPGNEAVCLALFALMPLIAVLCCRLAAGLLSRFLPRAFGVLSGGR